METLDGPVAVLPVAISLVALIVSGLTYRDRRQQDRRDLFLKLHERLLEPELQRGRRLLHTKARTVRDVEALRDSSPDEYDLVNRAVAMSDVAAMYVARGYVDRDDFVGEWGVAYGRLWLAAEAFLEVRLRYPGGEAGWPHFRSLGRELADAIPGAAEASDSNRS